MNKKIVLGALLILPLYVFAETKDSILHRDYSFISDSDPWLTERNAAALTRFDTHNISFAEVYTQYSKGGFVNYDMSPDAWNTGATVTSLYRLSQNIVLAGDMSYDSFSGQDMTGSAFIDTSHLPFDLTEADLSNAGSKHYDTYHLMGAISWNVYKDVAIGVKTDFTAANAAKYKDLRHKSKLMNLDITSGVYIPLGPLKLGADYEYRRNTQSVLFSTYAGSAQDYVSYINYGPWIGKTEQFSNTGFTNSSLEQPLLSEYQGMGIQIGWDISDRLTWYNGFNMAYREGYYGRKSPYTIVFAEHRSHKYDYRSSLSLKTERQVHRLDFTIAAENLVNDMTSYRNTTNEQGATYYQYFDPVKSANRLWTDIHFGYTGYYAVREELPLWMLQVGVNRAHRKQTGYDYPYYRRQDLTSTEAYILAEHSIRLSQGILAITAGFSYKHGNGDAFEDGTFITPSDKQTGISTMEAFLYREYEYLTAPQYAISGRVKYAFVFPLTQLSTYAAMDVRHLKANTHNIFLLGRDNTNLKITLGCYF